MSDTWYRDPINIPPYRCGDQAWTWDGKPANRAAWRALNPEPTFLDAWPEDLRVEALRAALIMDLRDAYFKAFEQQNY